VDPAAARSGEAGTGSDGGTRRTVSIPNLISLARLLAVPVAIYFILRHYYGVAFWVFVAAGVSDAVDGYIAKHFGQASALGAYLDPIADKALLVGVYLTLGYAGYIPSWLVILVVFRDVIIVGGVILLHILAQGVRMKPLIVSKVNTAVQIALIVLILGELGLGGDWPLPRMAMIYLAAVTTLLSGGAYIIQWFRHEAGSQGDRQ
jgi:cardiolipin synthase